MLVKKLHLSILFSLLFGIASSINAQNPVYNIISGKVWEETLPVNNVINTGEDKLGGVLVTLKNASTDEIISSAISDDNGLFLLSNYVGAGTYYIQYDYPTAGYTLVAKRVGPNMALNSAANPSTGASDPFTINSQSNYPNYNLGLIPKTNTVTFCADKDFDVTVWNDTLSLPGFDNTYDSLLKVTLFVTNAVSHPFVGVENTGALSATTDIGFTGRLTITPPAATNLVTNTMLNKEITLDGYDGNTDYEGTSGFTWEDLYSSATNSRVLSTASQFAPYIGTGVVNFPTLAKSVTSISGGGNLETTIETELAAGLCITYEYATVVFLPVSIKNISASTDGTYSFLKWTTSSEYQNKGFAIERSTDGKNFEEIGFAKSLAANGTSTSDLMYNYTDEHPAAHTNYYRLKQIDRDGKFVYSKTLSINILNENEAKVYPNPARDFVTVNALKEDNVIIFDLAGKVLKVQVSDSGTQKVIDVNGLPNGNYYLKLTTATGVKTSKFTVLR